MIKIILLFLCRVISLVSFGCPSHEKAIVAEIKIKAFETMVSKSHDGKGFACATFGIVGCHFSSAQAMEHRKPDHTLRFPLQPLDELLTSKRFQKI